MIILSAIFCFLIFAVVNIDVTTSINQREDRKSLDDIRFTPRQKQQMRTRLFSKFAKKWPFGVVPYTIEADIAKHPKRVEAIQDAIAIYNSKTCIKWIERTDEEDYVYFFDDILQPNFCYARLGMEGKGQPISITDGCGVVGIVLHEMMHTVGFWHEHMRPDRDEYVTIHMDLINKTKLQQFDKMKYEDVQLNNMKYDYDSIMHYPRDAFPIVDGTTTIETKNISKQFTIGQRDAFTDCDLEKLNLVYQCKDKIKNDPKCVSTVDTTTKPPTPPTEKPTPPPPTVFFPCVDASTSSCQQSLKKNKNYCEKGTANFAYARSSCCMTCAISKGFTMKQERKITKPNGEIIINYVTVVDLTGPAASSWAALPKVNSIYPGMNKIQTDVMCKQRARKYGTERFCADPYVRTICGETCLSYNYPI